ncbi:hypothetical protein GL273_20685 [Aeromonas jandaei]|uniref:hypothetical protein n=1 Tax=Aeromonas jandaei TaxID=650 RepID=UPI001C5AAD36|nr:hypothetical protein [Aeromonas jandaei]MBW3808177.1 hypothetical protein [Aeromonas jandaei]
MKNINWTYVFVFLIFVGLAIGATLDLTGHIDNKPELKKELAITHNRVKSDCQLSSKEKQFDSRGNMTITEKYACADGFYYSFSIP